MEACFDRLCLYDVSQECTYTHTNERGPWLTTDTYAPYYFRGLTRRFLPTPNIFLMTGADFEARVRRERRRHKKKHH